jgi:phosphoribosyl-ATP pyrophosphohydrolase/phosphoribosyl-AMP cyclohydrolase
MTLPDIKFDESGLVPVIVQDVSTRCVLMLAYMNAESLRRTLETGETWFWSRSRAQLWHKGETSGHTQQVVKIFVDCDGDALTVLVKPNGPACHTGRQSCFHNEIWRAETFDENVAGKALTLGEVLADLYTLVESRRQERPRDSYTTYLFDQGLDKILKKVGEESSETIIAAKNEDHGALIKESSDLLYHLLVLFVERGLTLDEVRDELRNRGQKSG